MTESNKDGFLDKKLSRRRMLKLTGAGAAGVAIGASGLGGVLKTFGVPDWLDDNPNVENKVSIKQVLRRRFKLTYTLPLYLF